MPALVFSIQSGKWKSAVMGCTGVESASRALTSRRATRCVGPSRAGAPGPRRLLAPLPIFCVDCRFRHERETLLDAKETQTGHVSDSALGGQVLPLQGIFLQWQRVRRGLGGHAGVYCWRPDRRKAGPWQVVRVLHLQRKASCRRP